MDVDVAGVASVSRASAGDLAAVAGVITVVGMMH